MDLKRTVLGVCLTTALIGGGAGPALSHGVQGMMGQGMGPGMMGPGYGMMGPGLMQPLAQDLSTTDVQHMLEHQLTWQQNPNLKIGKVEETDKDTITAEITTQDGSLVQRLAVDRHTGRVQPAQ
jgi:hypothetical protein